MADFETVLREQREAKDNALVEFIGPSVVYYRKKFKSIDETRGISFSFNWAAAILGTVWWISRQMWSWFWLFLFVESIAIVQISRGFFANLGAEEFARAQRLLKSAEIRRNEAEQALQSGADNASALAQSATALENASSKAFAVAEQVAAQDTLLVIVGIGCLLSVKLVQGLIANHALKGRFEKWNVNRSMSKGVPWKLALPMAGVSVVTAGVCAYRFTSEQVPEWLQGVPARIAWRRNSETWVDNMFQWLTETFAGLFSGVTRLILMILDFLEVLMIGTPWPIMMGLIILLAYKVAGARVAIFTGFALAYLGILGFWEQSMLTVSLLGSACLLSLIIGIPLGILCARKKSVHTAVWPILDLMQTMPSFVYLIPVIAFFGIGKPPGIIATVVFGMPPVVRLTVLGLHGVPQYVREAAQAFGASKTDLLFKIDLPLARPSIMTGINQTILMCLSMVVIASLIGAKGLGEEVLDALSYANEGKGMLAGLAILFCAMVLDRIIQGRSPNTKEKLV